MQKQNFYVIGFIILFLFLICPILPQDGNKPTQDPESLDGYRFVARGKMARNRGINPQGIAKMDNNGEILLACQEAKTVKQLESSGMKFLKSQLELLVDWNLLAYDRKMRSYKTTIHIYGTEKSAAIRNLVSAAVKQLTNELNPDLVFLKNHLKKINREKSLFSILYAYILHSYSMDQFAEEIYQKPQLSADNPFWNGYAWAIYPIKKHNVSVSVIRVEGNLFFKVSSAALPGPGFQQFFPFAKDVCTDNKVDNPAFLKNFSEFGIFDPQGNLTIPIFENEMSEKLKDMAKSVYAKTIDLVEAPEMQKILGMNTQAQAAMFIHYELRYAFLNLLLQNGTIQAPIDFVSAANNSPVDMGNLIFLMK